MLIPAPGWSRRALDGSETGWTKPHQPPFRSASRSAGAAEGEDLRRLASRTEFRLTQEPFRL